MTKTYLPNVKKALEIKIYSSSGLASARQVTDVTNDVTYSIENTSSSIPERHSIIEKK